MGPGKVKQHLQCKLFSGHLGCLDRDRDLHCDCLGYHHSLQVYSVC